MTLAVGKNSSKLQNLNDQLPLARCHAGAARTTGAKFDPHLELKAHIKKNTLDEQITQAETIHKTT